MSKKSRKTLPESVTDKNKKGDKPGKSPVVEPTVRHDLKKIKKPKDKLSKMTGGKA